MPSRVRSLPAFLGLLALPASAQDLSASSAAVRAALERVLDLPP